MTTMTMTTPAPAPARPRMGRPSRQGERDRAALAVVLPHGEATGKVPMVALAEALGVGGSAALRALKSLVDRGLVPACWGRDWSGIQDFTSDRFARALPTPARDAVRDAYREIAATGEKPTLAEIGGRCGMSESTVRKHLRALAPAGLQEWPGWAEQEDEAGLRRAAMAERATHETGAPEAPAVPPPLAWRPWLPPRIASRLLRDEWRRGVNPLTAD